FRIGNLGGRAAMSTVETRPQQPGAVADTIPPVVYVYSHSPLFYWWPVWVLGYVLAILTYAQGVHTDIGNSVSVWMHSSRSLGVVYTIVFLLVILMTNFTVRGVASLTLIVTILFFTVLFAYIGIWESIFAYLGMLAIYMNLGFYVFFSTALFIVWFLEMAVFCRLDYWSFHPGQAIHHQVF